MKFKQLFCRHKKLTAVGIYEKVFETSKYITYIPYISCECDRCKKEFEYSGRELDLLRHEFRRTINIDKVVNHKLWGKWW